MNGTLLLILVALVMLVGSYVAGSIPLNVRMSEELVLRPGSMTFDWWARPPVRPFVRVYVYNVTNADEFLNNGSKPILDELGPYVYMEELEKVNITDNENGTLSFHYRRQYTFMPELSAGPDDDSVVVPNIPMLSATSQSKYAARYIRLAMASIMDILNIKPFVKVSVSQLLWGYEDPLLKLAKDVVPKEQKLPYEEFGIFYGNNGTSPDVVTMFSGATDITKYGIIQRYNHRERLPHWLTDECNSFAGSDGSIFPPHITRNDTLSVYDKDLCRLLPLRYLKDVESAAGVSGFRFTPPEDVFANDEHNKCFCPAGPPCAPSGLFNVTLCHYDSPVMLSFPHFYLADPSLREAVEGISPPEPEKHRLYIDIHPETGTAMRARARMQVNLAVSQVVDIKQVANFSDIVFPILWFEEGIDELPDEVSSILQQATRASTYSPLGAAVASVGSHQHDQELVLRPGGMTFDWWARPPVRPFVRVYVYNVTNADEFLNNGSKPILDELGPYVYMEELEKVNIIDNENGTLSFHYRRQYTFMPELSAGPDDDSVVVPNIPMLSTTFQSKYAPPHLRLAIASILDILNIKPFVKVSVSQLLWGYEDPLLKLAKEVVPKEQKLPYEEFGIFNGKNGTSPDVVTMFSGATDITKYGIIQRYNHEERLPHWLTDECNSFAGSDGSIFPPHITRNDTLFVYDKDLCRLLPLRYLKDVESAAGVSGFRFTPPEDVFANDEHNKCFCPAGPPCAPSGLFNVTLCQYDSPVMLSFPHFYLADPSLREAVEGISPPDQEKHRLYIDIHPETGTAMRARARMQVNLAVSQVVDIKQVANFSDIVFPILWFEEGIDELPDEVSSILQQATRASTYSPLGATVPSVGSHQHNQELVLRPGSMMFNWWARPPVRPFVRVYVYNVTNADEFLNNGSKPILDELGPYVYMEELEKVNIIDNENGTLSFHYRRQYTFMPELSAGPDDDSVVVPNIPMLSTTFQSKYAAPHLRLAIASILDILNIKPFVKVSVSQLLWGYEDPLLKLAKEVVPKEQKLPYEEFGIFNGKNGTSPDVVTMFSGATDSTKYGIIQRYNHEERLPHWLTDECNSFAGSDGSIFPPHITRNDTLFVYDKDLCRLLPLRYLKDVESAAGVSGFRFTPPEDVFANDEHNKCFCPAGPPCAPSGLFNVTLCQYDSPVMLSFPHFYLADPSLREAVEGISPPDPEKHRLYIDIHPETGTAMRARARMQVNLAVSQVVDIKQVANFSDIVFPILWFEEGIDELPDEVSSILQQATRASTYSPLGAAVPSVGCHLHDQIVASTEHSKTPSEENGYESTVPVLPSSAPWARFLRRPLTAI